MSNGIDRLPRRARALAGDTRGAAALEMGLVGPAFLITALFLFELCFVLFAQQVMQASVQGAARQIETGQVQSAGDVRSAEQFRDRILCGQIAGLLDCGQVSVAVTPVAAGSDFFGASYAFPAAPRPDDPPPPYCNGNAGQMMVVSAVYRLPPLLPQLAGIGTGGASTVGATVSFIDEMFPQAVGARPC